VVVVADGFLGRWSQRKQALRQGREVDEPAAIKPATTDSISPAATPVTKALRGQGEVIPNLPEAAVDQATLPTPTLADVNALKADSSFAPFVSRDVAPEVRNAAMKKLFTDPHYNLMDGLDIYIDDYSKPDPMPASMLRQLASAKFLNLFDDEEAPTTGAGTKALPNQSDVNPVTVVSDPVGEPVPVLSDTPAAAIPNTLPDTLPAPSAASLPAQEPHHDHTDLRLQPNDAAGRPQSERVPE
jgi:hypothetical protein